MSDVEVRRNAPAIRSSPDTGSTEFVVDYPLPDGGGGRTPGAVQAAELGYAARPPLLRRPVVRRAVVLVGLAVVVGAGAYWFPRVRDHVLVQVWQHRCLNHRPPAVQVVYDGDPVRAAALLRDPRYRARVGTSPVAFLVPEYWSNLGAAVSPPGMNSDGTVFLGRMYAPGGQERLVAADLVVEGKDHLLLMVRVFQPGSLVGRPRQLSVYGGTYLLPGLLDRPVRVGRLVANDPSRADLFDGRFQIVLKDDDEVDVRLRGTADAGAAGSPGLTPPAPSSPASLPTSAAPATRPTAGPAER